MPEQQVGINRSPFGTSKKPGKTWLIISLIIISLLLVGGGVGYWQLTKRFNKQKTDLQNQINDLNKKLSAAVAKEATTTTTTTPVTETFDYAGWETYINDIYNYQFKHPSVTTIAEAQKVDFTMTPEEAAAGTTFDQLYKELTGKICLTVANGEGTIYISAPINKDFSRVICGRTGVGSEEQLTPAERTLTINGQSYTASGDKSSSGKYDLTVELTDDTTIEYSVDSNDSDLVTNIERIIESYQPI